MKRVADWEHRLIACEAEWRGKPFEWGGDDCLGFARACGEACRGAPIGPVLPTYRDEKDARRVLRAFGGDMADAIACVLPEVLPPLAQRGDWGVTSGENGQPSVVVNFGRHWLGKSEFGLRTVLTGAVQRAFKV